MAKKSKKQEEPKAPILTADEAWVRGHLSCVKEGKNAPEPAKDAALEGKAATPEQKKKTEGKLHWVPEGKDRTLCGIFHLDPRMTAADSKEEVTCAVCLKVLAGPSDTKRSRAKAERVTILCADCNTPREIYAYQQGTVTRCDVCQKRYRRRKTASKRRLRMKARKAEKRLLMQEGIATKAVDASVLLMPYAEDKAMLHAVIRAAREALAYKK